MSRLKDKAAIVTGAGSGIGRATALRFAKEGAHVILAGRRQSTVAQVAEEIRGFGGNAVALEVDVGIEEQVRDMIDATLSDFGRIDSLFNNAVHSAASSEPSERDVMAFDTSVFERIGRVNVLGGVWACKYSLPHMLARCMGAILFTSSTSAFAGDVGQFSYGASKAMVNWYIKTIARSEEHTSELQSLMRISYAVFCLKKKKTEQIKIDNTIKEKTRH